jgi:uncharacterized protein (DUF2141 family)
MRSVIILTALLSAGSAHAASVEVRISGVEVGEGSVKVAICDRGFDEKECVANQTRPASAGTVTVSFPRIPNGRYAVVAFQDANSNGRFDTVAGIPRETYDISGTAGRQIIPSFKNALVTVGPDRTRVDLRLAGVLTRQR